MITILSENTFFNRDKKNLFLFQTLVGYLKKLSGKRCKPVDTKKNKLILGNQNLFKINYNQSLTLLYSNQTVTFASCPSVLRKSLAHTPLAAVFVRQVLFLHHLTKKNTHPLFSFAKFNFACLLVSHHHHPYF